jgi:hypothetical protein
MASLTATEQAGLQSAIDLLVQGSAYETPLALDVIERLIPVVESLGAGFTNRTLLEAARDTPVSALVALVWVCGISNGTLTAAQSSVLVEVITNLAISTAVETPFPEDVIQRLAPIAEATGFKTVGGFYEAVGDNPVSTMLKWALRLGV